MLKKIVPILFFVFLFSCAEDGQITNQEVRLLNKDEISQFIQVLPTVLNFAERYNGLLSEEEKNSPNYNQHYFKALKKSQTIRNALSKTQIQSVDEFMQIYKNVFLAYYSLKKEITNEIEMTNRRARLDHYAEVLKNQIKTNGGKASPKIREALENLKSFNTIYSNILLVREYETIIDRIVKNQEG